jgi:hypothetical protein
MVIGGDVDESRRGMHLRGPIVSIEVRAPNLIITTEWTAIADDGTWRVYRAAAKRNPNVFTFDLRGQQTLTDDPQRGLVQVSSKLVTLTIHLRNSSKLDRSDVQGL